MKQVIRGAVVAIIAPMFVALFLSCLVVEAITWAWGPE